jgi:hypothetical protein
MEAAAAHLLNTSQPFDCNLLDQIVLIAMDGSHPQRSAANEFLVRMKEHPESKFFMYVIYLIQTAKLT